MGTNEYHFLFHCVSSAFFESGQLPLNKKDVLLQIATSINITGTSIKTPTTVANAAPEDKPKSIADVAIATSK